MSKRLSKIAKELNIGISTIAEFLNSNGYECEENPNEKIQEEVVDFLKNNISAHHLADRKKAYNLTAQPKSAKKKITTTEQIPLELKIIDAASKQKKTD